MATRSLDILWKYELISMLSDDLGKIQASLIRSASNDFMLSDIYSVEVKKWRKWNLSLIKNVTFICKEAKRKTQNRERIA